jgi:hypothetical protein
MIYICIVAASDIGLRIRGMAELCQQLRYAKGNSNMMFESFLALTTLRTTTQRTSCTQAVACNMTAHILLTVGDIECAVTVGSDLCYHTVQDGTIIIQTATDLITIQPRHIVDRGISTSVSSSEGVAQEDEGDSNRENLEDPTGSIGIHKHIDYNQEEDINVTNDHSSKPESSKPEGEAQRKKGKFEQSCKKLAATVLQKWEDKSKTWEKEKEDLLADQATVFGTCTSNPQWSYQSLASSENNIHLAFHKLNLYSWWSQCQSQGAGHKFKQSMYETLIPGYAKFKPKKKDSTRIQIARYVNQGEVLGMMYNHTKGLLITISEFITTAKYVPIHLSDVTNIYSFEFLLNNKNETYVSNFEWMPKDLLKHSRAFSTIVDNLLELYFPILLPPKSNTDLGTREETRGGQSRHALKRQQLDDRSDSHTSRHLESTNRHSALGILPASVVVDITNPIVKTIDKYTTQFSASNHVLMSANSTRKRQKTRDGGEFFEFLTVMVHKMTDIAIEANQPDGSAGLDDVPNRPQHEQYNISRRPNTLPYEQARDAASAVSASMITSSVDADIHVPPAPQPSSQDGPEHPHSPPPSSPNSQEVIDSSASALIGGRGEGSTLAESTKQTSPLQSPEMLPRRKRQRMGDGGESLKASTLSH